MKKVLFLFIVAATIAFAFVTSSEETSGYKVGDSAASFKLKNIDDKMVSLTDFKDAKGVVVIFTCNHCPYSVAYEDRIIELDKQFKKEGFPVVAVNPNNPEIYDGDSFEKMKERAKSKKFTFPYLIDEGGKYAKLYGATKTPHVYLLKKEKEEFKVVYIGAIDDNYKDAGAVEKHYLENAIKALIKGENPEPDFTKAIGCGIKI